MKKEVGSGIVAPTPGSSEGDSGHVATRMLVNILLQFHQEVHVFTRATAVFEFDDERIVVHRYSKPFANSSWYFRLLGQVVYQIKYSLGILRYSKRMGVIVFGGGGFILPAIMSRSCRIHVLYRIGGVKYKEVSRQNYRDHLWSNFLKAFRKSQYAIANTILVLSPSLIEFADVGRFSNKCRIFNHYYFDMSLFSDHIEYEYREQIIGHIGVSHTKGTMQLLRAYDSSELSEHYQLLIIGKGPKLASAKEFVDKRDIDVTFTGYINRSEMATHYNRMKLFVNCSESEGVPKAMFESMACGTPVAATPVGGVPDYLVDGENGFLLRGNDPNQLADDLSRIVNRSNKYDVAGAGRDYVCENFSYQSTLNQYYDIVATETDIHIQPPPDNPVEPLSRQQDSKTSHRRIYEE